MWAQKALQQSASVVCTLLSLYAAAVALTSSAVAVAGSLSANSASQIYQAMEAARRETLWPVVGYSIDNLRSTFGVRCDGPASDNVIEIPGITCRYDFHRGIDIAAPAGTPIIAPLRGQFFGWRNHTSSGLIVRLRHRFSDLGDVFDFENGICHSGHQLHYYYTGYVHLQRLSAEVLNMSEEDLSEVEKGTVLGYVGQTGSDVSYPHLHTEVRVGTHCSLERQLQNPSSVSCNASVFGFDPHVHPLLFFGPERLPSSNISVTVAEQPNATQDGRYVLTMLYEFPFLNRIKYEIFNIGGSLRYTHTLDYNLRTGFSASEMRFLDTPDVSHVYLRPVHFDRPLYSIEVIIPRRIFQDLGNRFGWSVLTAVDIYGNEATKLVVRPDSAGPPEATVPCPDPGTPLSSRRTVTERISSGGDFPVGSTVTFVCMHGELVGSNEITCLPNSNWSDAAPTCNGSSQAFGLVNTAPTMEGRIAAYNAALVIWQQEYNSWRARAGRDVAGAIDIGCPAYSATDNITEQYAAVHECWTSAMANWHASFQSWKLTSDGGC